MSKRESKRDGGIEGREGVRGYKKEIGEKKERKMK